MTVTNLGPDTVTRLTLSDPVPPALLAWTFTPSAGVYSAETGSWTGLNLGVGQSETLVLSGTVDPAATGNLVNLARVTPPVGTSDTNPSNDTDSDTDPLITISISDVTVTEGNAGTVNAIFTREPLVHEQPDRDRGLRHGRRHGDERLRLPERGLDRDLLARSEAPRPSP